MASGVQIADNLVFFFNNMKIGKTEEVVRLATFDFKDKCIDLDEVHCQNDLDEKQMDGYDYFKSLMTPKKCRYILYDCHYTTKDSGKEDLVFVMWCPDDSKPKDKLNFAASKDTLLKKLTGIKHRFEWTDISDCPDRRAFAEELAKDVISVEGVSVL